MDLTLLPEFDKDPFLEHLYGLVRIKGIRSPGKKTGRGRTSSYSYCIERSISRKSEITKKIFDLVKKHVEPLYERESRQQKKGGVSRSEDLSKRVKDVLKVVA